MSYTPTLGSKRVYTISSTRGPKLSNNTYEQNNTVKSHYRYIVKTNLTSCLMKNTLEF
jgi:hypothetical protein